MISRLIWLFCFFTIVSLGFVTPATAQIYETELDGLNAEQWADKIIKAGETMFTAEYLPLGEDYYEYGLLARISFGNLEPVEQIEFAAVYKKWAENSGDRRHLLISQMINENLEGGQDVAYFIRNGDWFTEFYARWIDATYFNRSEGRFLDLVQYYGPIIDLKKDDKAYPLAMVLYTDLHRNYATATGDLSTHLRNYRENYYWMKRLYPEYDTEMVFAFDSLTIHAYLFADPSALKIVENIDTMSLLPINAVIMANRTAPLLLQKGDPETAYNQLSQAIELIGENPELEQIYKISTSRARAKTALLAAITDRPNKAREQMALLAGRDIIHDRTTLLYEQAAKGLLDMASPTEKDIENWVATTRNGHQFERLKTFRQALNPDNRFNPGDEKEPNDLGLYWALAFTLLGFVVLSIWAFISNREKNRRLVTIESKHLEADNRATMLDQYLNDMQSLSQLSGDHTRNSLLSLERNISDPRTLEIVEMISRSISNWSGELANLIFSAKYVSSGVFEKTELISFPEFKKSAETRWGSLAQYENSTLSLRSDKVPQTFHASRLFMHAALDLFVQNALERSPYDLVNVQMSYAQEKDKDLLRVLIEDPGNPTMDFNKAFSDRSHSTDNIGAPRTTTDRMIMALKALQSAGGRYDQSYQKKDKTNHMHLYIPIRLDTTPVQAANSNQILE